MQLRFGPGGSLADYVEDKLRDHADRLARVEARLALLEGRVGVKTEAAAEQADAAAVEAPDYASLLTHLAVICFVLVGALLLRVATRGGVIPIGAGTGIGLAYCGLLLAVPAVRRAAPWLGPHVAILQICGVCLAPLVVLETFHRSEILGGNTAALILLAVGVSGVAIGSVQRRQALAGIAVAVTIVGQSALAFDPDALALRGGAVVVGVVLGLWIGERYGWPEVTHLALGPAIVLLTPGLLLMATRGGLPSGIALPLALAVVGVWTATAIRHAARSSQLAWTEAGWLVLATPWAYGLAVFYFGRPAILVGGLVALALVGALGGATRRRAAPTPGLLCIGLAGAVTTALSLPWVDPSGAGIAGVALLLAWSAATHGSPLLAGAGAALAVLAAVVEVAFAIRTGPPLFTLGQVTGGAVTAALLLGHYVVGRRSAGGSLGFRLAPAALACAIVAFFFALRAAAIGALASAETIALAQTVIIGSLTALGLVLGRRLDVRDLRIAGMIGLSVLAAKVILRDSFTLTGGSLVASVVMLGLVSLVASLTLRRSVTDDRP